MADSQTVTGKHGTPRKAAPAPTLPAGEGARRPPPLENGDRLTRAEFERRYEAMPEVKKAELIHGVAYMGSPVRFGKHGQPHARLLTWLGTYAALTRGVGLGDNATVRLDADTEPQPDALLRIEPAAGGTSRHGPLSRFPPQRPATCRTCPMPTVVRAPTPANSA